MKDEDLIASLTELCSHREDILDILQSRIKELELACWKYKDERDHIRLGNVKKAYNILKYLLETCNGRTSIRD